MLDFWGRSRRRWLVFLFFLGFEGASSFWEDALPFRSRKLSLGTALATLEDMAGRAKFDGAFSGVKSLFSFTLLSEQTSLLSLVFMMTACLGRMRVVPACLSRARSARPCLLLIFVMIKFGLLPLDGEGRH